MEEKLWLRPENETPFEFHRDSTIDEREKRIFEKGFQRNGVKVNFGVHPQKWLL